MARQQKRRHQHGPPKNRFMEMVQEQENQKSAGIASEDLEIKALEAKLGVSKNKTKLKK